MTTITKKIGFGIASAALLLQTATVYASAASIRVAPSSNNLQVGNTYTVDVKVQGDGQAFDTASATVTASSNLTVNSVILGNCGFSFVKTPIVSDLTFKGAILGGSSEDCTAYSLTLQPNAVGTGTITITEGSVISASSPSTQIISSVQNGNYAISSQGSNNPVPTSVPAQPVEPTPYQFIKSVSAATMDARIAQIDNLTANSGTYSLQLTLIDSSDKPAVGRTVYLSDSVLGTTDKNGQLTANDIKEGIYAVKIMDGDKTTAEEVINVSSTPGTQTLSIREKGMAGDQSKPMVDNKQAIGLGIGALIIVAIAAAVYLIMKRRKNSASA